MTAVSLYSTNTMSSSNRIHQPRFGKFFKISKEDGDELVERVEGKVTHYVSNVGDDALDIGDARLDFQQDEIKAMFGIDLEGTPFRLVSHRHPTVLITTNADLEKYSDLCAAFRTDDNIAEHHISVMAAETLADQEKAITLNRIA